MTLKNKLQSRIRGWFPQEPKTGNLGIASSINDNSSQPINPKDYKKETAQASGGIASIITSALFMLFINFGAVPFVYFISLLLIGLAVGATIRIIPTYRELKNLTNKGTSSVLVSEKLSLGAIFLSLGLLILCLIVEGPYNIVALSYPLTFGFACYFANVVSKALLFRVWESKNQSDVMRGKGYEIFSVPKTRSANPRYNFGREIRS